MWVYHHSLPIFMYRLRIKSCHLLLGNQFKATQEFTVNHTNSSYHTIDSHNNFQITSVCNFVNICLLLLLCLYLIFRCIWKIALIAIYASMHAIHDEKIIPHTRILTIHSMQRQLSAFHEQENTPWWIYKYLTPLHLAPKSLVAQLTSELWRLCVRFPPKSWDLFFPDQSHD